MLYRATCRPCNPAPASASRVVAFNSGIDCILTNAEGKGWIACGARGLALKLDWLE